MLLCISFFFLLFMPYIFAFLKSKIIPPICEWTKKVSISLKHKFQFLWNSIWVNWCSWKTILFKLNATELKSSFNFLFWKMNKRYSKWYYMAITSSIRIPSPNSVGLVVSRNLQEWKLYTFFFYFLFYMGFF